MNASHHPGSRSQAESGRERIERRPIVTVPWLALAFQSPAMSVGSNGSDPLDRSGDEQDAGPLVPGPNVRGSHANRQRGIPKLPEGEPHSGHVVLPGSSDVLDHNPSWTGLINHPPHLEPEPGPGPGKSIHPSHRGEILAREPPTHHVHPRQVVGADRTHVVEPGHVGPVSGEDVPGVGVALDLVGSTSEAVTMAPAVFSAATNAPPPACGSQASDPGTMGSRRTSSVASSGGVW